MPTIQISKPVTKGRMVVPKGCLFEKYFIFKHKVPAGDPESLVDLTGHTFAATIRKDWLSDVVVANMSFSIDIPTAKVFFWLPAATTAAILAGETYQHEESWYVVDFVWTRPGKEPERFLMADLQLSQGSTR